MKKIADRSYWLLIKYKYELQNAAISFMLINFLFFYSSADFSSDTAPERNIWDGLWFVVEAWLYVFFALGFIALNHRNSYRAIWAIMAGFLIIRAVWEISAVILGVSVNEKKIITAMFYLTCLVICIIAFYPQITKMINLCRKLLGFHGRWRNG